MSTLTVFASEDYGSNLCAGGARRARSPNYCYAPHGLLLTACQRHRAWSGGWRHSAEAAENPRTL